MPVIVIRGGSTLDANSFTKNSDEVTTGDLLTSVSVFLGEVKNLDKRNSEEILGIAEGCPSNSMSVAKRSSFPSTAKFKKDPKPDQPYHALLSGISVDEAVATFKKGVKFKR